MNWFKEDKPKTGSGKASPKGTRMTGKITPVFREANGKRVQPTREQKIAKVERWWRRNDS